MAHIYTYPQAVIDAATQPGAAPLTLRVLYTGRMKKAVSFQPNGEVTYGTETAWKTTDVTQRVYRRSPLSFGTQKPYRPTGTGTEGYLSSLKLTFINTDKYFAVQADQGIIDIDSITSHSIAIYLSTAGEDVLMFEGRVTGLPEEREGLTTFTVRDNRAAFMAKPLRWENLDPLQETNINEQNAPNITHYTSGLSPYSLRFYDAYTRFSGSGVPVSTVQATGTATLKNIDFTGTTIGANGLELGQYKIKFLTSTGYQITGPNFPTTYGNTTADLSTEAISIPAGDWIIDGDPTGEEIVFTVHYTTSGNPITLAKRLIEHGILGTWGSEPGEYSWLPVDWTTWNRLEKRYTSTPIFVSETNENNQVFEPGGKPLTVKMVVERILEHLGLSMIIDKEGQISCSEIYREAGEYIHPIDSSMVQSHSFPGGEKKASIVKLEYGNGGSGGFEAVATVTDFDPTNYDPANGYKQGEVVQLNGTYWVCVNENLAGGFVYENWRIFDPEEATVQLKYFPAFAGEKQIEQFLKGELMQRIWNSHRRVKAKVIPNHGFTLRAGDRVEFQFTEQPEATFYGEIVKATVTADGGDVLVEAVRLPGLPVVLTTYCSGAYCEGEYG